MFCVTVTAFGVYDKAEVQRPCSWAAVTNSNCEKRLQAGRLTPFSVVKRISGAEAITQSYVLT